ncbi:MAG: hypothetical protein MUF81_00300 [Verrucomicrobia bacterium]|jgi:hypothetical protein|nr:hypothetical protein [Verrucomicrobiota bacterium]
MITTVLLLVGGGIVGICLARAGQQHHLNALAAGADEVKLWSPQHWGESATGGQLPCLKAGSSLRTRSLLFAKCVCDAVEGFLK